jgi:glycosyltransferase DesVII
MRVLLTTPSSTVRLHNLVPLGWALRTSGHEVQVAGPAEFGPAINRTGFVAVPSDVDGVLDYAEVWQPDLVIWDELAPEGAAAAAKTGAASVRVRQAFEPAGDSGHTTLDSTPPSMLAYSGPGHLAMRHVPYAGSAVVPAWLRRKPRRDRVCLSLDDPGIPLATVFEAVAELDVEAICALEASRVPECATVPDNVRLFDSVPLNALLLTCSAIVHDGTTAPALAALTRGLPQLALTTSAEDRSLPGKLAASGAGLLADPGMVTASSLAARIRSLVGDPALRAHAGRLAAEVAAMPSPREIVPELVELATVR